MFSHLGIGTLPLMPLLVAPTSGRSFTDDHEPQNMVQYR